MRLLGARSLQGQLALSLAALYVVATAIVTAAIVYQAYSTADQLSNEDLDRRARHLASLVKIGDGEQPVIALPDWLASLYRSGTFLYAVRHPAGPTIAVSDPLVGDLISRLPEPSGQPAYFRLRHFGPGEKDYFGQTVALGSAIGPLWITIARAADDEVLVHALLREFVADLAWMIPLIVAGTLAIGVFALRRGLRPLRQASASAATIDPGNISVRLPEQNLPSEVQPLVAAVNRALDRLEKGFVVQRQFTADAAHQLRTPLSILTAAIDQVGGDGEIGKLKADVARMNRLVEQLLRVARLDAVALDVSSTVDLASVAKDVVAYMAPVAVAESRSLAAQGTDDSVSVKGNRFAIEDAVRNLVENAIAYAPTGSEIVVSIEPSGIISVADRGPGIPEGDRERVFDRFWRGKASRAQGSGLGLAIVREIMKAHQGKVEVDENPGGGSIFKLEFRDAHTASSLLKAAS